MVGGIVVVYFILICYWQMYFYINTTLALFGEHTENEVFAAISILLDIPGGDGLAMKKWQSGSPRKKQGCFFYEHHIRKADRLASGKHIYIIAK